MRLYNRYKSFTKPNPFIIDFPERIGRFKRSKWKILQNKLFKLSKKKIRRETSVLLKPVLHTWEKNKQAYKTGLLFKTALMSMFDHSINRPFLKKSLLNLENEKLDVLGFCVEDYSSKKTNELIIYLSFFKEADLKEKFFTSEDFDNLSDAELSGLVRILDHFYGKFDHEKIKRICASSFFMNLFSLCDNNSLNFFGKCVKDLTILQVNLFSQARYFKSLVESQAQSNPPPDVTYDPDKMVEWYESVENSGKATNTSGNSSGVGYVGASREELEKMAGGKATTLNEIAAKKGGNLTKEDFIRMHGL